MGGFDTPRPGWERRIRAAILQSIGGNLGVVLANFATLIVASRYLSTEDAGAYSVCFTLITIASTLAELNISNYAVQQRELTPKQVGQMLGLSLVIGVVAASALCAGASALGVLLGGGKSKTVSEMLILMSPILAMAPISMVAQIESKRDLDFQPIALSTFVAAIFRAVSGYFCLLTGFGVHALAVCLLLSKIVEHTILNVARGAAGWVVPRVDGWRNVLAFCVPNTLSQAAGTIGFSIAELSAANQIGLAAAAFFNRANALTNIYRTVLERAVMPVLSAGMAKEERLGSGEANAHLIKGMQYLSVVGWPAFLVLYVISGDLLVLFFGAKWIGAQEVSKILAIACAIYILSSMTSARLMTSGKVRILLAREVGIQSIRVALVVLAASQGLTMIGLSVLAVYAITFGLDLCLLKKFFGIELRRLIVGLNRSFGVSFCVFIAARCVDWTLANYFSVERVYSLLLVSLVSAGVWVLSLRILGHPLAEDVSRIFFKLARKASLR